MAQLGGEVVEAVDPAFQARIWGVRTQGLNIMMSMREAGKPVSFVEDCAVPLKDLAPFTDRPDPDLPQARHGRHLVRPRLGRICCTSVPC